MEKECADLKTKWGRSFFLYKCRRYVQLYLMVEKLKERPDMWHKRVEYGICFNRLRLAKTRKEVIDIINNSQIKVLIRNKY